MAKIRRTPLTEEAATPTTPPLTAEPESAPAEPGFFEKLDALPIEDWERKVVYLYRLWPKINHGGENAYIERRNTSFDEDDVLQSHGSGRYLAILKDRRLREAVAKHTFSVYHADLPPKVQVAHVLKVPENQNYWDSWGKVGEPQKVAATAPAAAPTSNAANDSPATEAAIRELADLARRAHDAPAKPAIDPMMIELWKDTAKDRDSLAQRLADKQNAANSGDQLALVGRVLDFTERLKPAPAPPQTDPLVLIREVLATVKESTQPARSAVDQVNELAALITAVREITEVGRPAPEPEPKQPPWWAPLLAAAAPAIVPFAQALAQRLMTPIGQQAAAPAGSAAPAIAAAPPPPTRPLSPEEEALKTYVELLTSIAPSLIQAVQNGRTGGEFAEEFIKTVPNGAVYYEQMRDAGAEMVTTLLQMVPDLWTKLNGLPRWSMFLTEFLNYVPQQQAHRPRIVRRKSPTDPDAAGELPPSA